MAANANTLVVFGSSADSYFIGNGRRYFVVNMPESFTKHVQTKMNIGRTVWISVNKKLDSWIVHNSATGVTNFNRGTHENIQNHLFAANGKFLTDFVTYPDSDDPTHFFAKGKNSKGWTATLPLDLIQALAKTKAQVPNFDAAITGMLFGKGKTNICMFSGGFLAEFDDEIESEEHPLYKILVKYGVGWCTERGSTLCFYDSRFFFLKFKRPGQSQIQMHWSLPDAMGAKLQELRELTQQPEDQIALLQEQQKQLRVANARMNTEVQLHNMQINALNRAGMSIANAVDADTIVGTRYYY